MITFIGNVSDQAGPSEAVTINITKPDTQVDTLVAYTSEDKSFSAQYDAPPGNGYVAVAIIDEDDKFLAATSGPVVFDVPKEPRTITLALS